MSLIIEVVSKSTTARMEDSVFTYLTIEGLGLVLWRPK